MNETEALLVVERGPVSSLRFALQQDQVTIGRSAGNELVLADAEVSRRHARVLRRADGYAVEDIGSTNGTFVNGQRISHLTLLQDGDTIDLGDTVRLRFVSSPVAPLAPPEPPIAISERPTEMLAPPPGYDAQPRPAAPPRPAVAPAPVMAAPPPVAAPPYSPPPARSRHLSAAALQRAAAPRPRSAHWLRLVGGAVAGLRRDVSYSRRL
jgi:predicted component of type VI protein secretion system